VVPLIYLGGAKSEQDMKHAAKLGVEGLAASSRFVFYGKHHAVLINYPNTSFAPQP
jgi:cyclase